MYEYFELYLDLDSKLFISNILDPNHHHHHHHQSKVGHKSRFYISVLGKILIYPDIWYIYMEHTRLWAPPETMQIKEVSRFRESQPKPSF